MSTYSKGKRREKECRDWWTDRGWLVDFKSASRWRSDDMFTHFDFVAIKNDRFVLVQVKSNKSDLYKARKKIQGWMKKNKLDLDCQVWLREDRKDWRACQISNNGHSEIPLDN